MVVAQLVLEIRRADANARTNAHVHNADTHCTLSLIDGAQSACAGGNQRKTDSPPADAFRRTGPSHACRANASCEPAAAQERPVA